MGAGLLAVSASICSGVAGCDVVTPMSSLRSSVQHGQSLGSGSMAVVVGVDIGFISMSLDFGSGRRGIIFWISVLIGRCQSLEVRIIRDSIMLMVTSAYTQVV